jgi:hypothetical protein
MKSEMEKLMSDLISFLSVDTRESVCDAYVTPLEVREKLRELGASEAVLVSALQRGLTEKMTAGIFDPTTAGGYDMYRYTTRHVREGQNRLGWELIDSNNIAMIRDPLTGVTIVVCAGDAQTGMMYGEPPKTKRSKGDVFLDISQVIAVDLFGEEVIERKRIASLESKTWLLLHYHSVVGDQHIFRAELSLPAEASSGTITKWSERIILHVPMPGSMPDDETANDTGPVITPSVTVRL